MVRNVVLGCAGLALVALVWAVLERHMPVRELSASEMRQVVWWVYR